MLKSKKSKIILCSVAAASLIVIVAAIVILNQERDLKEEIKLIFKTEIEVDIDTKLTADLLIEETNAEDVKIVSGDTSKAGEVSITVEAVLKKEKKEFSTKINVKDNENAKKDENDSDADQGEGKDSSPDEKATDDSVKKKDTVKNSDSTTDSSSTSNSSQTQNKPQDNSSNGSKDETPSVNPNPNPDPVDRLSESQYASQVFNLVNSYRTSQGLPALGTNGTIQSIASLRASDMATMGYASHTRPDGKVADAFWVEANYGIIAGGEDVFGGSQGFLPEAVVDSFINSPGHRAPIVSDMNKYMAVGVRYSGGQVYVSLNFQQ